MSNNFVNNLKKLRKDKGLTQQQLAYYLDIGRPKLGSWEESRAQPDLDELIRIADHFKITVDELIRNKQTS